jgi:hypothetical protein
MSQAEPYSKNSQDSIDLSEDSQFEHVCILLEKDIVEGLRVAKSTLRNKKHFGDLLERGLETANASEMEIWLKYLIPPLGIRYVINVLDREVVRQPQQVEKAIYWLKSLLKTSSKIELQLFKNLEGKMLAEEYKVASPSGKAYKLILKIKSTNEYAVFGGYQLGSKGSGVIAEILDSQTFFPSGGVKLVSPGDLEIVDPQPYN